MLAIDRPLAEEPEEWAALFCPTLEGEGESEHCDAKLRGESNAHDDEVDESQDEGENEKDEYCNDNPELFKEMSLLDCRGSARNKEKRCSLLHQYEAVMLPR